MLGFILGILFLCIGVYLICGCVWRKLRCQTFVSANVVLGCNQDTLKSNGVQKKNRFPQYGFALGGQSYIIIDYNAPRGATLRTGDIVHLFCDSKNPEHCWYTVGSLWKDAVWGILSLLASVCILILFLI